MKILIVTDNVAPYRIAWAEELGKTCDVTMAYYKEHDSERNDEWLVRNSKLIKMVKLPAKIILNRSISFEFINFYRKAKPEIVVFDGYGIFPNLIGCLYMKFRKKNFYINIDGVVLDSKDNFFKKSLKKLIFTKNATLLCGSKFTMDYLKKYGAKESNMVEHNFSSVHEYEILKNVPTQEQRSQKKKEVGLPSIPMVLAVGRFLKLKQFDMLIKAFSTLDENYQLVVIGEGPEKEAYYELIEKLSLKHVQILEFMSIDQLKKYYFAADVFVLPSYSEVWGLVLNEAMAYGALPIIASDRCVGGYDLIIKEKNGYQFQWDEINDLRVAMIKILNDTEKRISMSEESLALIRNYTIEGMARVHLECFKLRKTEQ